jgi:hypothetical protein
MNDRVTAGCCCNGRHRSHITPRLGAAGVGATCRSRNQAMNDLRRDHAANATIVDDDHSPRKDLSVMTGKRRQPSDHITCEHCGEDFGAITFRHLRNIHSGAPVANPMVIRVWHEPDLNSCMRDQMPLLILVRFV